MKKNSILFSLVIIASVIVIIPNVYAASEWSEDFEGDFDWKITRIKWNGDIIMAEEIVEMEIPGNTLKIPDVTPIDFEYIFSHQSDIKYGSWEFDLYIDENVNRRFRIDFMADNWEKFTKRNAYELYFPTRRGDFELHRWGGGTRRLLQQGNYETSPSGWYHFKITRDVDNIIIINVNDSELINVQDEKPITDGLSAFQIQLVAGLELDNVQVTPIQLESSSISVEVSDSEIIEGDSVTVSGEIEPEVPGVDVSITYSKPDSTTVSSLVTSSSDGTFTDVLEPDMLGSWSLEVSWAGEGVYEGASSQSVSFTVIEESSGGLIPGFPLPSIAIGLLFAVLMMLSSFFVTGGKGAQSRMRRRYNM